MWQWKIYEQQQSSSRHLGREGEKEEKPRQKGAQPVLPIQWQSNSIWCDDGQRTPKTLLFKISTVASVQGCQIGWFQDQFGCLGWPCAVKKNILGRFFFQCVTNDYRNTNPYMTVQTGHNSCFQVPASILWAFVNYIWQSCLRYSHQFALCTRIDWHVSLQTCSRRALLSTVHSQKRGRKHKSYLIFPWYN